MTKDEALNLALEALETVRHKIDSYQVNVCDDVDEAITSIREALAQPEQEPVAHTLNCICGAVWDVSPDGVEEMVHAPNPPQRKPLTEKRIEELYSFWVVDCQDIVGFARAVERTVKGEA